MEEEEAAPKLQSETKSPQTVPTASNHGGETATPCQTPRLWGGRPTRTTQEKRKQARERQRKSRARKRAKLFPDDPPRTERGQSSEEEEIYQEKLNQGPTVLEQALAQMPPQPDDILEEISWDPWTIDEEPTINPAHPEEVQDLGVGILQYDLGQAGEEQEVQGQVGMAQ